MSFNLKKYIKVKTNTLNLTLRAIINQSNKANKQQLVAYYSQKFIFIELNYKIYNKELLAIINAL